MRVTISERWDMGHRLPHHDGACSRLHGHLYVAEVSVDGTVVASEGASDEGMVADFGVVKRAVRAEIAKLDHRFLVCDRDPLLASMIDLPGVVTVPFVPTAENIAAALARAVARALPDAAYRVSRVRVFETPTSWADAREEDL